MFKKLVSAILSIGIVLSAATAGMTVQAESLPGNIELSRQAATEGMVLLENKDYALPIPKGEKVALFGKTQIDFVKGGGGSGDVTVEYVRNLLQGMQIKAGEDKLSLYQPLVDAYTNFYNAGNRHEMSLTSELVTGAANYADTAVVVIGRYSGEGSDRSANKGDYYLTDAETAMLRQINDAGFKKIIAVLNVGAIVDTSWIANYNNLDSVLLAWQPGMEGGLAVADILVGDVNPSGKLTDTFAKSYSDYPSSAGFNESKQYVNYTEDIYVGYRYFETFDPNYEKVNYEFGFGLSYTTFAIDNVKVTHNSQNFEVQADVTNTGSVAGKEVAQVYFSAPQGKLGKPAKELAAFAKTKLLAPGEKQTLTMTFAIHDMASYDDTGKVQKSAYLMEAGDYNIYLGNSIKNAGQNGIRYTYNQADLKIVEQLTEQIAPIQLEKRLLADGSYESLPTMKDVGVQIPAEGKTRIEAENYFKKHYHNVVDFSDNGSICGMRVQTSDAGNRWLTYALDVAEAGTYQLALGMSNQNNPIANALKVYVNETPLSGIILDIPKTGGKWNIQEMGPVLIDLPQGKTFLKLEFTKDNFTDIVDYITLQKGDSIEEPGPYRPVSNSGTTKIEAEHFSSKFFDVGTEAITAGPDIGGTSLKNLHANGVWVNYALDVQQAGTYKINMRLANGLELRNDVATVFVNNTQQQDFQLNLPVTSVDGNRWFNFQDFAPGTIELPSGKCVLRFVVNSIMGNFDCFTLEPQTQDDPSIQRHAITGETSTFQAETYYKKHPSVSTETIGAGPAKGGTCLNNMDTNGRWVSYALDAETAGAYDVTFQIANNYGGTSDAIRVYVNNDLQPGIKLAVPSTAVPGNDWFNFIESNPIRVNLPAGKCTFKVICQNGLGNLDTIRFTKVSAAPLRKALAQTTSKVKSDKIMFADVFQDNSLMDAFIAQLTDVQLADLSHGNGPSIPGGTGSIGDLKEYGIPAVQTVDGPAGVRLEKSCTAWPCSTLLACSWNIELLQQVGVAAAKEAKINGADIWLAPGMNIHRNPLCGRNFEYYSEDPLLSGKMAAAITKGVQSEKVAITIKHFAANNKETDRGYSDSRISERALREIYLKGFEIAVKEADPWSIMSSYNNLNGQETSENYALLNTILRDEWGFKGMVMTDWWNDSTAFREVKAGNDVKMASGDTPQVIGALKAGFLSRSELERNVKRILFTLMKTNAMDREIINPRVHEITASGTSRIKAIDFAWKSSVIGMEKCQDSDGGFNPTNSYEGNWLSYNINTAVAGTYQIKARVASPGGSGQFDVLVNGAKACRVTNTTNTGGWQNWNTTPAFEIYLPQGRSELQLNFVQGGFNLNWVEFELLTPSSTMTFDKESVAVNETFRMTVQCPVNVQGIAVANENGLPISLKNVQSSVEGQVKTFTADLSLGTDGNRELKLLLDYGTGEGYVDPAVSAGISITKTNEAPQVLGVIAPKKAQVNVAANYSITTNAEGSYSANIYNNTSKMGKTVVSKTMNADGTCTWVLGVKIGSAGTNRTLTAYAGNKSGTQSDPYPFQVTVTLV